jgi:hypothetical protein
MFKKFLENKRLEKKLREEEEEKEKNKENDTKNRTFIITKIDVTKARKLIENKFDDPNDYLKVDKNMIIGKKNNFSIIIKYN